MCILQEHLEIAMKSAGLQSIGLTGMSSDWSPTSHCDEYSLRGGEGHACRFAKHQWWRHGDLIALSVCTLS